MSLTSYKTVMFKSVSPNTGAHVLVIPYPSQGHMIPILNLTNQLLARDLNITVLVTPAHLPLLDPLLSSHPSTMKSLVLSPPGFPPNPELLGPIAIIRPMSELSNFITEWFKSHPSPPVAVVSDHFLGWTHNLASNLGVPRVAFWSSGAFAASAFNYMWRDLPKADGPADESLISFPNVPSSPEYPWWQVTHLYRLFKEGDSNWEFIRKSMLANTLSWGTVMNSFNELEQVYLDHLKKEMGHDRVWSVGPLLPPNKDETKFACHDGPNSVVNHEVLVWLDSRPDDSVVYVSFGSRWTLMDQQLKALALALERSDVHFIWVMRKIDDSHISFMSDEFENRVKGKGFVAKGWVPQVDILRHRAVGAFVTHCGWNSVLEGLAAGVLMLTWPLGADQFANTKLLVDRHQVAIRFSGGGNRVVPDSNELARLLVESVHGSDRPERAKVVKLKDAVLDAINGGSSSNNLDELVKKLNSLASTGICEMKKASTITLA